MQLVPWPHLLLRVAPVAPVVIGRAPTTHIRVLLRQVRHLHNIDVHRQMQSMQCALDVPLKAVDDKGREGTRSA